MRQIILIISFLLVHVAINATNNSSQLVDSAAIYYSNGKYEKAIETYEQILANGYESGELYYNLGNAYFKSNKIAYSIVNYERAKKLMPNDEDIEFNLRLANTNVIDKIDVIPEFFLTSWWSNFIKILSSNQWAYISMVTFVLSLVLLLIFFLSQKVVLRKLSFWVGVFFLVTALFSFNFSRKQKWFAENEPEAIILTPSIVVRSAPSDGGTELFLIHEGLKVKVTDRLGEWREVRLSDGNKGWIKESDVIII